MSSHQIDDSKSKEIDEKIRHREKKEKRKREESQSESSKHHKKHKKHKHGTSEKSRSKSREFKDRKSFVHKRKVDSSICCKSDVNSTVDADVDADSCKSDDDLLRDALLDDVIKTQQVTNKSSSLDPLEDILQPVIKPPQPKSTPINKYTQNSKRSRSRSPVNNRRNGESNKDNNNHRRRESIDSRKDRPSTSSNYRKDRHRDSGANLEPRERRERSPVRQRSRERSERGRNTFGRDADKRDNRGNNRVWNRRPKEKRNPDEPSYLTAKVKQNANEVKNRKLLWQKGKEKPDPSVDVKAATWNTMLQATAPGQGIEKFKKLMGFKVDEELASCAGFSTEEEKLKQAELMHNLDRQYEVARSTTHMNRGLGLGFRSQMSDLSHQLHNAINK